jgi:hypothetical protein
MKVPNNPLELDPSFTGKDADAVAVIPPNTKISIKFNHRFGQIKSRFEFQI